MSKNIFIILVIFLFSINLSGQELKNYNLYSQNPILYNPAFAVGNDYFSAYSNSHLQWISFNGAPKTYDLGASVNFFPKMGAGFSVVSSQQGLLNNIYANLKYGYELDFNENHYIRMGLSFGVANDRILTENAENIDITDQNLTSDYYNKTVFSSGFGLAYKYNSFNAQIIMPQLFEYKSANLYTIGVLGYEYQLNDSWDLKPSVMFRGAQGSPLQFDGNIGAMWNKTIWAQVGYRSNNSFIFSIGADIGNYSIGYAYQADTDPISTGSTGSHEIQLVFKFNKDKVEKITPKINVFGLVSSNIDNKPIDAEIKIYENDIQIGKINSNSETGIYGIELSAEKTYRFNVASESYKQVNQLITLTKDMDDYEQNFRLISENAIVYGQTFNKINGNPVKSEVLFLEDNKVVESVQTDENGNYTVSLKSGKTYSIKVNSVNFEDYGSELKIDENVEEISEKIELMPILMLSGIVTNSKTGEPISVNIDIFNNENGEKLGSAKSDINGKYSIKMSDVSSVSISASADGYLFFSENLEIDFSKFVKKKDIKLQPMEIGASVVLNNVNFDTGKSELRPESYPEINRLIYIMIQYPSIKVEISGHTDNTGNDIFNKQLSQDRAQAVVDYMFSKGISKNRLKAVGFGSAFPRASNDNEEGKQQNRRVEAKILSE
ncbi:MAG: PorP/SprF family type IX secretion system membrane protein [Bacteroidales bacterium]|nr:PorP/SprF family type IX secretion system membrane protein [Bacteroidales bacterium]